MRGIDQLTASDYWAQRVNRVCAEIDVRCFRDALYRLQIDIRARYWDAAEPERAILRAADNYAHAVMVDRFQEASGGNRKAWRAVRDDLPRWKALRLAIFSARRDHRNGTLAKCEWPGCIYPAEQIHHPKSAYLIWGDERAELEQCEALCTAHHKERHPEYGQPKPLAKPPTKVQHAKAQRKARQMRTADRAVAQLHSEIATLKTQLGL